MNNLRFSRRNLLKGAGLGAATHMLLPELRNPAYAAETVPKMFVMFYSYHGTWKSEWGSGNNGALTLGPLLQPLAPLKDDIVLVSGLDMRSAYLYAGSNAAGHIQGQVHSLTSMKPGTPVADEGSRPLAGGPSIDQAILDLLKAKNGGKPLTEIDYFAVSIANGPPGSDQMMGRAGYRRRPTGAIQYLAPNDSPDSVWRTLFGAMPTTGAEATTGLQRKLMAQFAKGQFQSTSQKVKDLYGSSSQERFNAHAEYMSSLEQSLAKSPTDGGGSANAVVSPQACKVPERSSIAQRPASLYGDHLSENMPKLVQLGLACGRARFATVCIEANIDADTGLHNWMHEGNVAATRPYFVKVAEQVAKTLKLLKETPTADGKNLLYHTTFLWAGELSDGLNHQFNDLNWVVGGQAGGALQTGRFVNAKGRSNADLFVSLGKLMDSGMSTFGDPLAFEKPLEAIKA